MTVGFFLVDTQTLDSMAGYAGARALVRSVRQTMPRVKIAMLTDGSSPEVEGVDFVRRYASEPMARLRMRHHKALDGDWLFVDADVLIQKDVRDVFDDKDFEIAVTLRDWPHLKPGVGFTERMPYNMGVVFSRSKAFWAAAFDALVERPKELQRWMGDQEVFCELIVSEQYRVRRLSGTVYNFPPIYNRTDETPETRLLEADAAILHFKGPQRKPLMLSRIGETVPCV